jgi:hypothetical protein
MSRAATNTLSRSRIRLSPGTGFGSRWGRLPSFAEEAAHAHTHPNNTYFSNIDLETARGERGLVKKKTVMYMVNKTGAYWYDGRTEELSPGARHGVLWGEFPK